MKAWPWPNEPDPIYRDVYVADLIADLRLAVGMSPDGPTPGELAASRGQPLPDVVNGLDVGAWIAWCLAGLPPFANRRLPKIGEVVTTARRVLLGVALERVGGNLTRGAALIETSRRAFRDYLRRVGLYRIQPRQDEHFDDDGSEE